MKNTVNELVKLIVLKFGFYSVTLKFDGGNNGNLFVHEVLINRYEESLLDLSKKNSFKLISVNYGFMSRHKLNMDAEKFGSRNLFWSVSQKLAIEVLKKYNIENVDLFQHGYFDFKSELKNSSSVLHGELTARRVEKFLVWDLETKALLAQLMPRLNTVCINFSPTTSSRNVVAGIGFGLRGPEFLKSDLRIIKKITKNNNIKVINAHLHPACGLLYKIKLVLYTLATGRIVLLKKKSVSLINYSSSLSFLEVGKKMGVRVIYVVEDAI